MGSSKKPQDATRQERKAKKRMLEDAVPDLPGDVEETADIEVAEKAGKKRKRDVEEDVIKDKERKVKNKDKKRRKKEAEDEEGGVALEVAEEVKAEKKEKSKKDKKAKSPAATEALEAEATVEAVPEEAGPKKSKKERKAERRAKEAAATGKSKDAAPVEESEPKGEGKVNGDTATNGTNGEAEKKSKKNNRNREKKRKGIATAANGSAVNSDAEKPAEQKDKKDARFICFIGNLPFSANTASIMKHFAAVKPKSVRALTKKEDPTKSKGCAFIEFEGYDHMKTCLKMFHHSTFDDGVSAPRKINVELTAGGGGNTKERRGKIEEKNQKLNEQRARRMQEEEKTKLEKSNNAAAIDESAIHPSRRTRVPGA